MAAAALKVLGDLKLRPPAGAASSGPHDSDLDVIGASPPVPLSRPAADYASARCLYQRAIALGMGGGDAQVRQLGWPASARSLFLCMLSLTRSRPRAEDPPPEHSS